MTAKRESLEKELERQIKKRKLASDEIKRIRLELGKESPASIRRKRQETERLNGMLQYWTQRGKQPTEHYTGELSKLVAAGMTWVEIECHLNRNRLSVDELAEVYKTNAAGVNAVNKRAETILKESVNISKVMAAAAMARQRSIDKEEKCMLEGQALPSVKKVSAKITRGCSGFNHPHFHQ